MLALTQIYYFTYIYELVNNSLYSQYINTLFELNYVHVQDAFSKHKISKIILLTSHLVSVFSKTMLFYRLNWNCSIINDEYKNK